MLLLPGYPAFCVSQLAGNGKDLHGVSATDEHAASHALCGLCIPRQIANGVCTIEQVKLAASVWFSEDERDAGFRFTYQPGLVSSQRVVEMCRTEHLVEADLGDWEESFNQNLYFLLCFLPSLVENDQCHTS